MDQQGILALVQHVQQQQQLPASRPLGRDEGEVVKRDAFLLRHAQFPFSYQRSAFETTPQVQDRGEMFAADQLPQIAVRLADR